MKKRIAFFANGWSYDNIVPFTKGLMDNLPERSVDIFTFLSHETYGQPDKERKCQEVVFKLPDLAEFDVAIVLGAGLNFADSIKYIYDSIESTGIPCISVCNYHKGAYNIIVDNYSGMLELSNYVIEKNCCKNILFVAGSAENEDSNIRLKALSDALSAHNLPAPDVIYSNWEVTPALEYLDTEYHSKNKLPDAIICANDSLASSIIMSLDAYGHTVPEDIIVTGFDHLISSQIFYPSIASVDQRFDEIGRMAAEALIEITTGKISPRDSIINSVFYPGESCGYTENNISEQLRRKFTHEIPNRSHFDFLFSNSMITLEQAILQSQDYKSLEACFKYLYSDKRSIVGDSFFVMLDPNLEQFGHNFDYVPFKFSDTMHMAFGKLNGVEFDNCDVRTKDILPELKSEENLFHIVSIFFYEDMMCGYFVFTNLVDFLKDHLIYDFSNKMNRINTSLKRNLQLQELNTKLSELMEQDTLTHVKNRAAYEKYLHNFEADFVQGENPPFAVVYFDINNLKTVNDMYGHEKGDAYIRNSCKLICNTFKHSPVFRIGGDEFVSVILGEDYENRHLLLDEMISHMKVLKEKGSSVPLTERISIAYGMAEYDRTLDENFASIFKRADEIMYENKYKMKKEMN